ncbi:hypothetical protein [Rhodopseudomonas sp. P2A-2r]|uniref:hypothetical protein n=1 Tax=unclassified Rhodopseudomonas TaxID=2638247 RepID=UPI0022344D29|nr:hypothetical protein [Rhodopseudomonas sp. P2A-2r]UZE49308.1 hypothetical protein ONR75_00030 [Rhodopseudomonas sp. P2A-2r]
MFALRDKGLCPVVEPAAVPRIGVFIVRESIRRLVKEPAVDFQPVFLTTSFPGPVSYYNATEVQVRSETGVEVLGRVAGYEAPGYLGFPLMVGCFERPDNIIFIIPPGEPGCGLWRRTVQGKTSGDLLDYGWIYSQIFQPD